MMNSDNHLKNLRLRGYTIVENVLNDEQIEYIKSRLDDKHKRCGDLIERGLGEVLVMEPVWSLVWEFLNGDMACATWSSNTVGKSLKSEAHWHVDYPYHDVRAPFPSGDFPLSCQTLWMLDDFTVENGATVVIPCSHRVMKTHPTAEDVDVLEKKELVGWRGSVAVFHGGLWHREGVNTTDCTRSCLLGTFVKRWIKPKNVLVAPANASEKLVWTLGGNT